MTPRVLAGAPALDRRAFPRPDSVARWFEPFHIRQPQVARGEISAQVAGGADIVLAPAWLTHRRALEAVGESRRARAWTDGAVRLAREAVEAGLERRAGEGPRGGPILVAGPLPDVSAGPEHATGRLLTAAASEERDTHDQAGILADVGVDLLLLERRATFESTLHAARITVPAGRPVWVTLAISDGPGEPPLADRVAVLAASGVEGILVEVVGVADDPAVSELLATATAPGGPPVGVLADQPPLAGGDAGLDAWLGAGVAVLGLAAGADAVALAPLVEARERMLAGIHEREGAARSSLGSWVADAAQRAPGGRALWLGTLEGERPSGFEWTILAPVDPSALAGLPGEAFRLIVAVAPADPDGLTHLVERGGIVALECPADQALDLPGRLAMAGLRVQDVGSAPDGAVRLICRREDA